MARSPQAREPLVCVVCFGLSHMGQTSSIVTHNYCHPTQLRSFCKEQKRGPAVGMQQVNAGREAGHIGSSPCSSENTRAKCPLKFQAHLRENSSRPFLVPLSKGGTGVQTGGISLTTPQQLLYSQASDDGLLAAQNCAGPGLRSGDALAQNPQAAFL